MSTFSTAEVLHFAQEAYIEAVVVDIEPLAQAGSDRMYYRIRNGVNRSIIATQSDHVEENERFILLANYFEDKGISVPQILAVHPNKQLYLQHDAGTICLLDVVHTQGHTDEVKELYRKALQELIRIQFSAKESSFKTIFEQLPSFGYDQISYDLQYFKSNFLLKTAVTFDNVKLEEEFDRLAKALDLEKTYFMYRDCQGRNIMVQHNQVVFIDFQGGLQGHPMYDVASLLWQAKARIPKLWKVELVNQYLSCFEAVADEYEVNFNRKQWERDYEMLTLIRLLQVLGAYGLRGLAEGKKHFISSIPLGLYNIKEWLQENELQHYPELMRVLQFISSKEFINKF